MADYNYFKELAQALVKRYKADPITVVRSIEAREGEEGLANRLLPDIIEGLGLRQDSSSDANDTPVTRLERKMAWCARPWTNDKLLDAVGYVCQWDYRRDSYRRENEIKMDGEWLEFDRAIDQGKDILKGKILSFPEGRGAGYIAPSRVRVDTNRWRAYANKKCKDNAFWPEGVYDDVQTAMILCLWMERNRCPYINNGNLTQIYSILHPGRRWTGDRAKQAMSRVGCIYQRQDQRTVSHFTLQEWGWTLPSLQYLEYECPEGADDFLAGKTELLHQAMRGIFPEMTFKIERPAA